MTRIGYYELYECPKCQQIHIKPEYSSISLYMGMPPDAHYDPTDLKICQKCGKKIPFSKYLLVGRMKPPRFKEKVIDPRKLFPRLSDRPRTLPLPDPKEIVSKISNESFYQFGRKTPKSFISSCIDKCRQYFRPFRT